MAVNIQLPRMHVFFFYKINFYKHRMLNFLFLCTKYCIPVDKGWQKMILS